MENSERQGQNQPRVVLQGGAGVTHTQPYSPHPLLFAGKACYCLTQTEAQDKVTLDYGAGGQ